MVEEYSAGGRTRSRTRAFNATDMHDSIEADFLATRQLPFPRDAAAWIDHYVTATSRLDPVVVPDRVAHAARAAWRDHGWAHPAVVAYLEHELGPLDAD